MKKYFYVLFALITLASCSKDYFEDTGVHDENYPGTVLKYIQDKPATFSQLAEIIKIAGMEEVFDKQEMTFFAPQNVSIAHTIRSLNDLLYLNGRDTVLSLDQIRPEVWQKFLGLYVIPGKYELRDLPQVDTTSFAFEGQSLKSLNGRIMNAGLMYHDAGKVQYAGYRMVMFAYIRDFADTKRSRINVPVSSANIKPSNGVVHVLRAKFHNFGFEFEKFYEAVTTGGLLIN